MSDTVKRQNNQDLDDMDEETKRLKIYDQRYQIIKAMENLHKALKPRYVRLDDFVLNCGLQHLARYIFKHLNYESIANCRLVSKDWKDFIDFECDNLFSNWKLKLLQLSKCKYVKIRLDVFHFWQEYFPEFWSLEDCHPDFLANLDYLGNHAGLVSLEKITIFMNEFYTSMDKGESYFDSPLHYAAHLKRFDVFEILRQTPMDIDVDNAYNTRNSVLHPTLLGEACALGQLEVIEYFINLQRNGLKKIDFNKRIDHQSYHLFHQVCLSSNPDLVRLFLKHANAIQMDLNVWQGLDGTPFMKCIFRGRCLEILEILLKDERIGNSIHNFPHFVLSFVH